MERLGKHGQILRRWINVLCGDDKKSLKEEERTIRLLGKHGQSFWFVGNHRIYPLDHTYFAESDQICSFEYMFYFYVFEEKNILIFF